MNTLKTLKDHFYNITKLRIFEIEVMTKKTQENEYVVFYIEIQKNTLLALHESLNSKQEKSKKISFVKVVLNNSLSIDENLQNLYDECINAILKSEFFELI